MHMREQEQPALPWLQLMHSSCKGKQISRHSEHAYRHTESSSYEIRSQQGTAKAKEKCSEQHPRRSQELNRVTGKLTVAGDERNQHTQRGGGEGGKQTQKKAATTPPNESGRAPWGRAGQRGGRAVSAGSDDLQKPRSLR